MEIYRSIALVLLLCLLYVSATSEVYTQQSVAIDINEHGVASVELLGYFNEGLQTIRVPVKPIPETIIATAEGEPIPVIYEYENDTLYLIVQKPSSVEISYIANVSILDSIFCLVIETNATVTLRISIVNIVLLTVPRDIIGYKREDDTLILTIRGPQELRYTLRLQQITQTPPTQTPTTNTQTTQQTPQPSTEQPSRTLISIAIPAIAVAIAGTVAIYVRRRRGQRELVEILGDVDIAIIKILDSKGGSALQTELQNEISIPKTTLWRHIKKLEKLGILRVEKVGLQNRIVLIKKVKI